VIANPKDKSTVMSNTGIAHNICHEKARPRMLRIIKNTANVGKNLITATSTAEIGSIMRGNAVFKIKRCPAVIERTPLDNVFETK
jgi:hypothetical protein